MTLLAAEDVGQAGQWLGLEVEARRCRRALRSATREVRIETEHDAGEWLARLFAGSADLERGQRIAAFGDAIAEHLSLTADERQALYWAGRALGLCRRVVPLALLRRPSALSRDEMEVVRRAPTEVFEALLDQPYLSGAGYLLRSLRERPDGRGYPDGLAGRDIPLGCRILAVAEAVEAIAHDQPYRPARSPADTVLEILRCAGTQFDADVVHAAALVIAGADPCRRQAMTPLLIVEDEELMASTIGRWLGSCGYEVAYAASAVEAIDAMKAAPAAVAICDVGLPGDHDGLWLVDELRRTYPTTAVVISTGRDYLPASATMRDGVVSYLLKPFDRDTLRSAVIEAVRWHENATSNPGASAGLEQAAESRRLAVRRRMEGFRVDNAAAADRLLQALCDDPLELARCARVVAMADAIAGRYPMSGPERTAMHWAGQFQLLCRLPIPASILLKPDVLTDAELAIVRRGPHDAYLMMRDHSFLYTAAPLIRSIREREDGLGLPRQTVGLHDSSRQPHPRRGGGDRGHHARPAAPAGPRARGRRRRVAAVRRYPVRRRCCAPRG